MSAAFQLIGGHPVLDLVNTLDNRFVETRRVELLPTYADVLRFARQSQILSGRQIAHLGASARGSTPMRVLRGVLELREAMAELLYAGNVGARLRRDALELIEHHVIHADAHRELVAHRTRRASPSGASFAWAFPENRLELPLWVLSKSAEALLTTEDCSKIRACQRENCQWLFLDSSKNHSRRWCDMKICGNRAKAQRFHAKHSRGSRG
jgi:predicted RNA-binding Zn ribbon-like protein